MGRARTVFRLGLRILLGVAAGGVGLLVLGMISLLLPPVRDRVLTVAVRQAQSRLPGDLGIGGAAWPSLGEIELTEVLWTQGGDTLFAADTVAVRVDLGALTRRDVHARRLVVTGLTFDLPALQAAFPPSLTPKTEEPDKDASFPRGGALPGVPSIAVDELTVRASRVRLSPTRELIDVTIAGGGDLSRAGGPRLELSRLTARSADESLRVDATHLEINGVTGILGGDLTARLDSLGTVNIHLASTSERLNLTATLESDPPGSTLGLELRGRPSWKEHRLHTVEFALDLVVPRSEDLAGWPSPISKAADVSPLPPVPLHANGVLTLRPRFEVRGRVESEPAGWLERLEIAGSYREDEIDVDTVRVRLPGLRVDASGRRTESKVAARLDAAVTDGRWLALVSPGINAPDSLAADIRVSLEGAAGNPKMDVDVTGGYRQGTLTVREAEIAARFPEGPRAPGSVSVSAVRGDLRVRTRAALALRAPLDVELSPIWVESLQFPGSGGKGSPAGRGRIRFDASTQMLEVEGIRVIGDLGTGRLDGKLHRGSGTANVAWEFPEPPSVLRTVIVLPDSTWDSLRVGWPADGPFEVRVQARLNEPGGEGLRMEGEFRLPGPRSLRAFLPAGARVDDLGAVSAKFSGGLDSLAAGSAWTAMLDLTPTPWIATVPMHIEGSRTHSAIDSLGLGTEGLSFSLRGGRTEGVWDVQGTLGLSDARLVRRLVPALSEEDSCSVVVEVALRGADPDISIRFRADGRYRETRIAGLTGHITRSKGLWEAHLGVKEGLTGSELTLTTRAVLDRHEGWSLRADTLGLSFAGRDLRSRGPFRVAAGKGDAGLRFEQVDLEGSLGSLRANGVLRPEASEMEFLLALDLDSIPPPPRWVPGGWPQHVEVVLRHEGTSGILAEVRAEGLQLSGAEKYSALVTVRGDAAGINGNVLLRSGEQEPLRGEFFLPGTWQTYPLRIQVTPRGLRSRWVMDELPVPWEALGVEGGAQFPAILSGEIRADSDEAGPLGRADLTLLLRAREEGVPSLKFTSQAVWIAAPSQREHFTGDTTPLSEVTETLLRSQSGPGLVASFGLSKETTPLLTGTLLAPFRETPGGKYALDAERGIDLDASAPRLDLSDLNVFLPADHRISGMLAMEASLQGPPKNPTLKGHVEATGVELQFKDGGRAAAKGKLEYSGTLMAPNVEGKIEVQSALLPIPEAPRKLHPPAGQALLWKTGDIPAAVPDTAAGSEGKSSPTKADADTTGAFQPRYDLQIIVPSGVWIRGRSLNVELGGDLRLRHQEGHPTVVGDLEARQGTMTFLGRTFQLERGKVQFYGEDELDPALDVRLTAKVSTTTVWVTLSGTAREPKIELTSSPSMSEADIMSLLVMGKTSDDLEGDQAELVAQRAAAIAATYGAAELQKSLSGPLGVDMITLNPGGGPEGESSVVVGKYLSPRALIKYEQAIDSAAGFFVTLQYTLTQTITLETIAGTWQSGAEISWSKDY